MLYKVMKNGEIRNVVELDDATASKAKSDPSSVFKYPVDSIVAVAKDEKPIIGRKKK